MKKKVSPGILASAFIGLGTIGAAVMLGNRERKSVAATALEAVATWVGLREKDPDAQPLLKEYWKATGLPFPGPEQAWSAAFVSWVVQNSTTPNALPPAGAHIYYARAAYLNRGKAGKYGAYRPDEVPLSAGDIILWGRDGVPFTFDDITDRKRDFIPTHGDVVTEVSNAQATIVGGNVGDTVKARHVALNDAGRVADPRVVAVLALQS